MSPENKTTSRLKQDVLQRKKRKEVKRIMNKLNKEISYLQCSSLVDAVYSFKEHISELSNNANKVLILARNKNREDIIKDIEEIINMIDKLIEENISTHNELKNKLEKIKESNDELEYYILYENISFYLMEVTIPINDCFSTIAAYSCILEGNQNDN